MREAKRSKTDSILQYLVDRANRPVELSEMSSDLGYDGKIVATIASRLTSRGYVKKVKRGVYMYEERSVASPGEVEVICASLAESAERTIGRTLMKKLGISRPAKGCSTFEDLESYVTRLRGAMGTRAADDVLSVVIGRELPPKRGEILMRRLEVET
jgi:hypothetical protein